MAETKCYQCGKEIYFDENWKSKTDKYIPLQKDTKKPHKCPKSKHGKLIPTYKGSYSKYRALDKKSIEGSSFAQMLKNVDQRDLARIGKRLPQSFVDTGIVIEGDEIELKTTQTPSGVEYFVGCDEAGTGETFGSMFLGCVLVDAENLKNLQQIFDIQNIKALTEYEILDKYNKIKKYCKFFVKKCEASEIDRISKNTLLDQKYTELLTEAISKKEKLCVIIDDYGITRELKSFLERLRTNGNTVIHENKADERYAVCQAASVVARKERFDEIRDLNKNFGVQDEFGKTVYPGEGSASNPQTAEYLEAFMKKYPAKDLPFFVRRKWSNVQRLLQQKSNQKISRFFEN